MNFFIANGVSIIGAMIPARAIDAAMLIFLKIFLAFPAFPCYTAYVVQGSFPHLRVSRVPYELGAYVYTLAQCAYQIFQKRLLFLLPFYVMRYEDQLKQIDESDERSAAFIAEFSDIRQRLDEELSSEEQRDTYTRLMELTQRICDYVLQAEEKLQEGVRNTMGGQVLELKTDKIIAQRERAEKRAENRGLKQGRQEGIELGTQQGSDYKTRQVVRNMLLRGSMTDSEICGLAECDLSLVDEVRQGME